MSEKREQFSSGAERSADLAGAGVNPVRYDLLPTVGIRRLAETMAHGAAKYGEGNWQKGIPIANCMNHALAHLFAYQAGDRTEDHIGHAMANLCFVAHFEERRQGILVPAGHELVPDHTSNSGYRIQPVKPAPGPVRFQADRHR